MDTKIVNEFKKQNFNDFIISFLFGKNNGPIIFLLKYNIIINNKQNNIIKNSVIIKVPTGPDIGTDLF